TLGAPTPPQAQGWPAIQRGDHTLILAPTGSGKTLTAFLWAIDRLFHTVRAPDAVPPVEEPTDGGQKKRKPRKKQPTVQAETQLLYISPLKALNNDIERNLRTPLAGIRKVARERGEELPEISVAVRSGDTPSRERQAMVRKPPHILITTPESLYIMLTSPKARDLFRTVQTVIVDEIHTLAGSKRGVHLALTLERLQKLADQPVQRIGLSATIQPLAEVARYLGGADWQETDGERQLVPRPVTIVDAGYRKQLDLRVETVVADFRNLPGDSIWPSLIPRVAQLIEEHKTTLIFTNNRRQAERTADRLNEQRAAASRGEAVGLLVDNTAKGTGMFGATTGPVDNPIRAHHGSMSKETRLALETDLKAGKLPALVGTSSLELGIDIGAVDLVVQIEAPKAVAQGLQRVGRAGHLVGQTSKGRIFPTHRENLMEAAAVVGGMLRGEVEPIHTPRNALDVLAQQIVAMVAVDEWSVDALYDLICQAYPYRELTQRVFRATLAMLAGHYPSVSHRQLRARLVWDQVNHQLAALPGSRLLALTSGGTITDRGAFSAYLSDGKTKLGELDEEFVYETRVGDTLILGSQVWRVTDLTDDKVLVAPAPGATPRMPFWRGD
ncbi:MAG: DEAD/DEAH box helicase, partial [Caldilineaceae bacterium]|nr:DEAD/DEAH box helicase [Caldilineaceae bacterium]